MQVIALWVMRAAIVALLVTSLGAQTYFQEDWSGASGLNPPLGWSSKGIAYAGGMTAPWRFDNPGLRNPAAPFASPFAVSDPGYGGPQSGGTSILLSPPFSTAGAPALELSFDQQLRDLSSGWAVAVFDGSIWNTVAAQVNNSVNLDIGWSGVDPSGVLSTHYDISAAAGAAANTRLRFTYQYGFDWWWAIDNVKVSQPPAVDLALLAITAPLADPQACIPTLGLQTVTVTFQNQGALPLAIGSLIQLSFAVNGGPSTTEFLVLASAMNPADTRPFSFAAQATLIAPGPNSLIVAITIAGDGNPANDSVSQTYGGGAGTSIMNLPYSEDFNGSGYFSTVPPPGWLQDQTDGSGPDSDWYMLSGMTASANTGPIGDHGSGSGFYAYVEDSIGEFAQVNLLSPCLDLGPTLAPVAQFWMHSWNDSFPPTTFENHLSVDVIVYPGAAVVINALGPIGHLASGPNWAASTWTQQTLNLAPFAGQTIRLVFRGSSNNSSFAHDIAIDDLSVFDTSPSLGQAPRPGLGVFDINGAINVNNAVVPSGQSGPYFALVSQGGPMAMTFGGPSGQPVTLLYGPLNPGSASYGSGIGQFDIGGPGIDLNGIPLNLGVFVDAIGWAHSGYPGTPLAALFFTDAAGDLAVSFQFPNFNAPSGTILAAFQAAVSSSSSPFVYLSNAVELTIN